MDLVKDNIKTLYRKYLAASLASALVMSIYSFVDTIAVGQSEGPVGAAAMAVLASYAALADLFCMEMPVVKARKKTSICLR